MSETLADRISPMLPNLKPDFVTKIGGIEVYANKDLPTDAAVIGYPDGKGGFKDGWVMVRNIGKTLPKPTPGDQ